MNFTDLTIKIQSNHILQLYWNLYPQDFSLDLIVFDTHLHILHDSILGN